MQADIPQGKSVPT